MYSPGAFLAAAVPEDTFFLVAVAAAFLAGAAAVFFAAGLAAGLAAAFLAGAAAAFLAGAAAAFFAGAAAGFLAGAAVFLGATFSLPDGEEALAWDSQRMDADGETRKGELTLEASLTLPPTPLGRVKTPVSEPLLIAYLYESKPGGNR